MRQGHFGVLAICGACGLILAGCGGNAGPEGVAVSGSVVQAAKPQEKVIVTFAAADPTKADSQSTKTDAEGKFALKVKPGAYTVTIVKMVDKKGNVPPESDNPDEDYTQLEASGYLRNALSSKYASTDTSPFKVEIPAGGKTLEPFDLK